MDPGLDPAVIELWEDGTLEGDLIRLEMSSEACRVPAFVKCESHFPEELQQIKARTRYRRHP